MKFFARSAATITLAAALCSPGYPQVAAQPALAPPASSAEAAVSVPREVLERYVGRYELNGGILTVGLTDDGRLTAQLSGQPAGSPLRTVSANEFANDAVGVRLWFEGDGPKATRVRSRYNGSEVVGTRMFDTAAPQPAAASAVGVSVEPALDGLFRAFGNHPVVALGDPHGLAEQMEFYAAVVRDPRFARDVRNVVVEFGASSQQAVIDRYVAGETVPYAELRKVWNDTVGWAPPPALVGFVKFFAAVREVNKALPRDRRIKVWLGEPPLDWSAATPERIQAAMGARDTYPAALIRDRILAKGEKTLVIYGLGHIGGPDMKGLVEAAHPGAMFAVLPYAPPLQYPGCAPLLPQVTAIWPAPALATRGAGAGLGECFTLTLPMGPPPGGPPPGGPPPGGTLPGGTLPGGPAGPPPAGPGPGPLRGPPPPMIGDAILFLAPLEKLAQGPQGPFQQVAQGRFLPDYLFDKDVRAEARRRGAIGAPPLMPTPPGLAIRKADFAFDLDAPGFQELIDSFFAAQDRNRNGVITSDEYHDPLG